MTNTLTTAELRYEIRTLKQGWPFSDMREIVLDAEKAKLEARWREGLNAEYARDLPKTVQDEIYALALKAGHTGGYDEVQNCFIKYAASVRRVFKDK